MTQKESFKHDMWLVVVVIVVFGFCCFLCVYFACCPLFYLVALIRLLLIYLCVFTFVHFRLTSSDFHWLIYGHVPVNMRTPPAYLTINHSQRTFCPQVRPAHVGRKYVDANQLGRSCNRILIFICSWLNALTPVWTAAKSCCWSVLQIINTVHNLNPKLG